MSEKSTREAAEAKFAAKLLRGQEARRAVSEYEADARRVDQNTARLKALRLEKEAAEAATEKKPSAAKRRAAQK